MFYKIKRELYLFFYDNIFKDRVLFKKTQSSLEIGVIVVKKHVFLNFMENYVRLKWKKKKVKVIITIIIEYTWICLNKQRNLKRKKLYRTNEGSTFPGGSFGHKNNVRAPVQYRREIQRQHLKRWFCPKKRIIHFHRSNKTNSVFSSIKINKPLPGPVHSV